MKKMARAGRQRIPAFGEWNYAYVDGGAGDWPITQCFDSAMHAGPLGLGLVMAIPPKPPANKVEKWREESGTLELQRQHVVAVGLGDHGGAVKEQGKQQQSPNARVHASSAHNKACRVGVAKAMDQDLYHIPPDMLCHEPRKRVTRRTSLWMGMGGCLGLNCVA